MAGSRPVPEMRQRRPDETDRAPQGAIDGGLPGGLIEVLESAGWRPTGVDHEQVEPAECRDGRSDRVGRPIGARQVGRQGGRIEARRRLFEPISRPCRQSDVGSLGSQHRGDRAAEPAAPAADQRARTRQSEIHVASLSQTPALRDAVTMDPRPEWARPVRTRLASCRP